MNQSLMHHCLTHQGELARVGCSEETANCTPSYSLLTTEVRARPSTAQPGLTTHLVKLIDQANTSVSQHEGSSFQSPLLADWMPLDIGCETHGRSTLASGEDGPAGHLLHVL